MAKIDLGINSDSIKYEVALEILGQELQPFMDAIRQEKGKAEPSQAFIRYCEMRMAALWELQDSLRTTDLDMIEKILEIGNPLFRRAGR